MSDENEKIEQFIAVTGVSEDRARFFLESSSGHLEIALSSYYEQNADGIEVLDDGVSAGRTPDSESSPEPPPKPKPKSRNTHSNFATLNTLNRSDDEDEEAGQAFYAGGSEHSGQQVLGPPKKKKDFVAEMFKSVQEHGVEILEQGAGSSGGRTFKGTGYKLGQTEEDSVVIPGTSEPPQPVEITLKLWRDGFSVDEGDIRSYTDPSNREFLESIRRGEIPQELRQGTSEVHLAMEDHRMDQFKHMEGKRSTKAFSGQGYTLGSPAPPVVGSTKEEDKPVNEDRAKKDLAVNSTEPTTSLQIRLADGTRLVGTFNQSHTVGHVRSYINTARPQYQIQPFNLLSTYPSRLLEDSETLAEAGLLNAAIMQKLV